jgi:hypothetical protein
MQNETTVSVVLLDYLLDCTKVRTGMKPVKLGSFRFNNGVNIGHVIAFIIQNIDHLINTASQTFITAHGNSIFTDFFRMSFTLHQNTKKYIYNLKNSERRHFDRFSLTDPINSYGDHVKIRTNYNRFRKQRTNVNMLSDLLRSNTPCKVDVYNVLHKLMITQLSIYPVNDRMLARQQDMHRKQIEYTNFVYTHWRNGVVYVWYASHILPSDIIGVIKGIFINLIGV